MRHVAKAGSLDSAMPYHRLAARTLFVLLLMPVDDPVHRRKDRLAEHAALGCVRCRSPDAEAKMGATLVVGLQFEAASGG